MCAQSTFVSPDQLRIPTTPKQLPTDNSLYQLTTHHLRDCEFSGFGIEFEFPAAFVSGVVMS